jgi:hypothetical protein
LARHQDYDQERRGGREPKKELGEELEAEVERRKKLEPEPKRNTDWWVTARSGRQIARMSHEFHRRRPKTIDPGQMMGLVRQPTHRIYHPCELELHYHKLLCVKMNAWVRRSK